MTPGIGRIAGVVLAGGRSTRFGSDKAEQLYRGRKLIDWSLDALRPHAEILFVAGRDYPPYASVADRPHAGLGPLGGIAGALGAAQAGSCSHLLSLPCDTPHIPDGLLAALCRREGGAYVASCPVIGLWPASLASPLERHLADGGPRAIRAWAEIAGIAPIDSFAPIANVNSVADLADLTKAWSARP